MSVTVKNIKRSTIDYRDKKIPGFDKVLGYIDYLAAGQKKEFDAVAFLPHFKKNSIKFEIHDTMPMFANIIRTYLLSGCLIKCMTFDTRETDSLALIVDALKVNINAIPIKQDYDYTGVTAKINIRNTAKDASVSGDIDVMSSHIEFMRDGKSIPVSEICNKTYLIATLPKGCLLKMDLRFEDGYGFDAENRFQAISKFTYRELDKKKPTLEAMPTAYEISFRTYVDDDPILFIKKMEEKLNLDLDQISGELDKVKGDSYVSDFMRISTKLGIKEIELINIPGQLAHCIARYTFNEDPEIRFVSGYKTQLSSPNSLIKISSTPGSTTYLELLKAGIKKIKSDIAKFVKGVSS